MASRKGHVRNRGKDSWQLQWYLGRDEVTGKPIYKSKTVHCKKKGDAQAELNKILHEINTGVYIEPSKVTVADYLCQWIESIENTVSASTHRAYKYMLNHSIIPSIGKYELSKLQPLHLQGYYNKRIKEGLSTYTIKHEHCVINKALSDAVKWQMISKNPANFAKPPKLIRKDMSVFSTEQIQILLNGITHSSCYIAIMLAITTGMRRGELLALQWRDIDLDAGIIYVQRTVEVTLNGLQFKEPKTTTGRRSIHIPVDVTNILKEHKQTQPEPELNLVCTMLNGSRITPKYLSSHFPRLLKNLGLPQIRFHDLRHSHASYLLLKGTHPKVVQERLGHSSISITLDIYSHVAPSMQEQVKDAIGDIFKDKKQENTSEK